jgi:anti-sigma regulatory factor (Ser/Thr protein kinase)
MHMIGDNSSPLEGHLGGQFAAVPRFVPQGNSSLRTLEASSLITHLELGALATAPGSARAHTRAVLAEWGLAELTDSAELLVSELATNAVVATRAVEWPLPLSIHLWLQMDGQRLLIAVWDVDIRPPVVRAIDEAAESGRGLHIVERLSTRWGWYPTADRGGKCVWAEVAWPPLA